MTMEMFEACDLDFFHLCRQSNGNEIVYTCLLKGSAVFSGVAGGARAPPEFRGSGKGRSLISAYRSLAITTNTPGFKKLTMAL